MEYPKKMTAEEQDIYVNAALIIDKKMNMIIKILVEKNIFTPEEAEELYKITPFN
jgi:hypothetical protein